MELSVFLVIIGSASSETDVLPTNRMYLTLTLCVCVCAFAFS